jgi:hypothetical protein
MNSTLTGFVIRYRRSRVLRFNVSSGSSRQSMTANCATAKAVTHTTDVRLQPNLPHLVLCGISWMILDYGSEAFHTQILQVVVVASNEPEGIPSHRSFGMGRG